MRSAENIHKYMLTVPETFTGNIEFHILKIASFLKIAPTKVCVDEIPISVAQNVCVDKTRSVPQDRIRAVSAGHLKS